MMNCSWSTVLNPCNLLRYFWESTQYCWRRLYVSCTTVTTEDGAPTVERIVAFQPTQNPEPFRRQFSLQARHGSDSSTHDSSLSDPSPVYEQLGASGSSTQPLRIPGLFAEQQRAKEAERVLQMEQDERVPEVDKGGQILPYTPLLHRKGSQKSQDRAPISSASTSNQPPDPERFYSTF